MSGIGYDASDNITSLVPEASRNVNYSACLSDPSASLKGKRFGLIQGFMNLTLSNETDPVNQAMSKVANFLRSAGAEVININLTAYNSSKILAECDVQQFEYRQAMDAYLARPSLKGEFPSTLEHLYRNTSSYLVIPAQYSYVQNALVSSTTAAANVSTYQSRLNNITTLQRIVLETFRNYSLDAFIHPQQSRLVVPIGAASQIGRNGILAAVTGYPAVDVPIGYSMATKTAPIGIPIGMDIYGLPWSEGKLLGFAKQIQDLTRIRKSPPGAIHETVNIPAGGYTSVPTIVPNGTGIASTYTVGTLM